MIITDLKDLKKYSSLNPLFNRVAEFLEEHSPESLAEGRNEVKGEDIFINSTTVFPKPESEQFLEVHRKYIDIHIPISGDEIMGWKYISYIKHYTKEYSSEKDCALSDDRSDSFITIKPGQIAIVFPEDGHAPGITEVPLKKLIVKVRV